MMKKLLSIILAICMLLTMFVMPAVATDATEDSTSTGHLYYNFDFSEDKLYTDYENPVLPDGVTYDSFDAVGNAGKYVIGYGKLGDKDALYVRATTGNPNIVFTPLKEDGTPIVLEAGKQYVVKWDFSITRFAGQYARPHIEPYTRLDGKVTNGATPRYNAYYTPSEGVTDLLTWDGSSSTTNPKQGTTFGSLYGHAQINYWHTANLGTSSASDHTVLESYTKATTDGVNVFTATTSVSADASSSVIGAEYSYTKTLTMATDEVLSSTYNVTKNEDGSYSFNDVAYNNFLGLSLPGSYGNTNYIAGYDEKSAENLQDADGNWYHRTYSEYYITGLTVYEVGVGSVNFNEADGKVNTVTGAAGETAALYIPTAPEGKYFIGWYSDADYTTLVTSAPTFKEGVPPTELYAKFGTYQKSATMDLTGDNGIIADNNNDLLEHAFIYNDTYYAQVSGDGYGTFVYTDEGLKVLPSPNSYSKKTTETPNKTFHDTTGFYPFYTGTTNFTANGDYASSGWNMRRFITVYNEDGTPFIAKPNTDYKITITYKTENDYETTNTQSLSYAAAAIGYKYSTAATNATKSNNKDLTLFDKNTAIDYDTVMDDFVTTSYNVNSGSLTDDMGVVGVHFYDCRVIGKKTGNQTTDGLDIYEVVDVPAIIVKEVKVEEVVLSDVTFVDVNGNETVKSYAEGETIEYPTLAANMNYDLLWSLSADEYVAVPTVAGTEDITVYAYNTGVVGFENYLTSTYFKHPWYRNASFSTDVAYSGTTSMKFRNYNVTVPDVHPPTDWETNWTNYYAYNELTDTFSKLTTEAAPDYEEGKYFVSRAQGQREQGTFTILNLNATGAQTYTKKVTLKYYIPESNESGIKLQVYQYATESIWWNTPTAVSSVVTIPADATDGWQTIEILVTATDLWVYQERRNQGLYIKASAATDSKYAIAYFDDVVVEDYDNTPTFTYDLNDASLEDIVVTEGVTAGAEYTIDRVPETAPAGKYFMGWYSDEACTEAVTSVIMPSANQICTATVYAKWGEYTDRYVKDYAGITSTALTGIGHLYNGTYYNTVTEGGYAKVRYTDEGLLFTKDGTNQANTFNPAKTDGLASYDGSGYVTDKKYTADSHEIGEITTVGWGGYVSYVLRDEAGNAITAKPNTSYAAVITYKVTNAGSARIYLTAGRTNGYLDKPANAYAYNAYTSSQSEAIGIESDTEVTGEYQTATLTLTTGDLTDGAPVFGFFGIVTGFRAKRVEAAVINGESYESYTYTADGTSYTVYPYEVLNVPELLVSDITLIEVEEGNTAVTYNYYEDGVGFSADIKDAPEGTAIDVPTKNVDTNWYTSIDAKTRSGITTYPASDKTLYNAGYLMANVNELTSANAKFYFGSKGLFGKAVEKDGKTVYALNYNPYGYDEFTALYNLDYDGKDITTDEATKLARVKDLLGKPVNVYRLGEVIDGHTYKVTFSYMAKEMNTDLGVGFATGQMTNVWGNTSYISNYTIDKSKVTADGATWYNATYYITPDLGGTVTYIPGGDDTIDMNSYDELYIFFTQSVTNSALEGEDNDIYMIDFNVEDMDVVISNGRAAVLTAAAAETSKSQAMRFYFDYATTDGTTIDFDGNTFTVVERGFIYKNGDYTKYAVANTDGTAYSYKGGMTLIDSKAKVVAKKDNFNTCWDYADGKMTFSNYVHGFTDDMLGSKLIARAYITFVDGNGVEHTVYSDTINRSVDYIKAAGYNTIDKSPLA